MKKSKIIALLLSLTMVFSLFGGITVLADEEESAASDYAAAVIGENIVAVDGDSYILAITPEETSYYNIYSTGDEDPYAYLYDSSWNYITGNDDYGSSLNFFILVELEAGETYYLETNLYGNYSASFSVFIETYDVYNGACGDGLTYSIADGVLTISGTGEMYVKYEYSNSVFPWSYVSDEITSVVIEDGVTSIAASAFSGYESITSVSIGSTVTTIAYGAFKNCTSLTDVAIPSSVTSIEGAAFSSCASLSEITFEGSAPAIAETSFYEVTAVAYYPASDSSWTSDVMLDYGGTLTWTAYGAAADDTASDDTSSDDDAADTGSDDAAEPEEPSNDTGTSDDAADDAGTSGDAAGDTETSDETADTGTSDDSAADETAALDIIDDETSAEYTLGSGGSAVIAVDADIADFVSVAVDGTVLTADTDYTVTEGSTIVTFTESYLESLAAGTYAVVITFTTGTAEATLTIAEAAEETDDSDSSSPTTGDTNMPVMWACIFIVSAAGLAYLGIKKKLKKE